MNRNKEVATPFGLAKTPFFGSPYAGAGFTKGRNPLFAKEGLGEIFRRYVFSIIDSLVCIGKNTFNPRIVLY
jgi:hypothetical protein